MNTIGMYVLPVMIFSIVSCGLIKGVNIFDCFLIGAKNGMNTVATIMPSLIGLVCAVSMMKNSGALDIISNYLGPVMNTVGIPKEVVPLAVLCPISGTGALSMYETMFETYGVDTYIERVASIMMGSTETTFYAVTVYYGSVNLKKTRHTVPAALMADFTSFVMSALTVRLMF